MSISWVKVQEKEKLTSPDMLKIVASEKTHINAHRLLNILLTFTLLFITMMIIESIPTKRKSVNIIIYCLAFFAFIIYCVIATVANAKYIFHIHEIKRSENYDFDENDLHFDKSSTIAFLVSMCFFAGVLSGILGIAGGTIMSPLFLSLGMLPSVTAATN